MFFCDFDTKVKAPTWNNDRSNVHHFRIYENIQLPHEVRVAVEEELQNVIAKEKEKYDAEMDGLLGQKRALEHKSEKLLEAHYSDAIPLELLKKEQAKITKELAAINHEIKQHNITFDQISQNLTDSLELLDDCAAFYKGASDTIKRLMNQAIFEKIYISCNKEIPLEIEEEYNPPFNSIIAPVKEELTKLNRSLKLNTEVALVKIATSKNRILKLLRCGLSSCNNYTDIESYSNPKNFRDIFSSKGLLVGLLEIYSKNYLIVAKYVKEYRTTSVKSPVDPSITDLSYEPNSIVKTITQQQKTLSELEIRTICERYKNGASSYELAKEFGCHRRTISDALKRNGVEVSHQASKKPELVKKIIELYAEYKTPKEVGAIVGIGGDTVRKVLKENGIYIRKSWEYPKK